MSNSLALSEARISLIEQGIVRSGFGALLGATLVDAEPDAVTVAVPFRSEVTTVGPLVHGGAIAGLIDIAATAAFWADDALGSDARGTTIGFSVSYLRGAVDSAITATARVRRRGGSICVGDVSVANDAGDEVAVATVTYKLSR